jgi:transposase
MSNTIQVPEKKILEQDYAMLGSVQAVADKHIVSKTTASKWLNQYGIKIKPRGRTAKIEMPSRREFSNLRGKGLTCSDLADHYGVSLSTIYKWRKAIEKE